MKNVLFQTYIIILSTAMPTLMGYIVWLLQRQKKDRDANSKGTMLLLRVQLIEYHDKYMKLGEIPSYAYSNFAKCMMLITILEGTVWLQKCIKR